MVLIGGRANFVLPFFLHLSFSYKNEKINIKEIVKNVKLRRPIEGRRYG